MKVGFTGTRLGMTEVQEAALVERLRRLDPSEFHHGDCVGADEQAHDIARFLGLRVVGHPPTNSSLRAARQCDELWPEAPYLLRNRQICDEVDVLLAAPDGAERVRSGTWSTVRYALWLPMPVVVLYPDGRTSG